MDDWIVIGGKGKPRKKQPAAPIAAAAAAAGLDTSTPPHALPGWNAPAPSLPPPTLGDGRRRPRAARTPEERLETLAAAVDACRREVAAAPVLAHLRAAIAAAEERGWRRDRVRQLVVYGLGCVEDSRVSRYQLALALLLRELLPRLSRPPQLFDPAFSAADTALLSLLGLEIIPEDERGGRAAGEPTLFYLPHCEAALCDNLLAANWSPERLPNVAVLGNSFGAYRERWAASGTKPGGARPDRLLRLVDGGAVTELPVPDAAFHVASAFNDSSLHVFPADTCRGVLLDGG